MAINRLTGVEVISKSTLQNLKKYAKEVTSEKENPDQLEKIQQQYKKGLKLDTQA